MLAQETKDKLFQIIFGTDTPSGRLFDILLIVAILLSVVVALLDSLAGLHARYDRLFIILEWGFTLIFAVEYVLRLMITSQPWRYARSFYGIVDFLSILPAFLSLIVTDANVLVVVRLLRIMRVFRVLKLFRYWSEANILYRALWLSRRKIMVFFFFVLVLALVFGAIMYVVEGAEAGFTSIPKSIYWTIVTITTVGYGDIIPVTPLGQFIAAMAMLVGYSIIAIPTGIVTAELSLEMSRDRTVRECPGCHRTGHDQEALFCKYCGHTLFVEDKEIDD